MSTTQSRDCSLPEQFGRYRILEKIGEGGMGSVYLAEDTQLNRRIALKVPHFSEEESSYIVDRFYREARAAAGIEHPNICAVYDVGQIEGIHYLTMPYIEGKPLSRMVGPDKKWEPEQALELVAKLASALAVLHDKGVIHRDLKAGNVLLRPGGEPVLMDFGLARSFSDPDQRLTSTGQAVGTPAHMSPEQITGESSSLGPAADIYALGVLLYQLLTGHFPFEGPLAAVYGQILHATPLPPSAHHPELDSRIDLVCLKALAKRPQERYASMLDFVEALQGKTTPGFPPSLNGLSSTQVMPASEISRIACPQCGKKCRIPSNAHGKKLRCPACRTVLLAAGPANPVAGPPVAPTRDVPTSDFQGDQLQETMIPIPVVTPEGENKQTERVSSSPTGSRALVSLLLGVSSILCLLGAITGVPALVVGILGVREVEASKGQRTGKGLAITGMILGSLGSFLFLLFLLNLVARLNKASLQEAERKQAEANLIRIGRAIEEYYEDHQQFPSPFVLVKTKGALQGKRPLAKRTLKRPFPGRKIKARLSSRLSWRVAILPYLGEKNLYDQFELEESWDSAHNSALLSRMPAVYSLPGVTPPDSSQTPFRAFVGPNTVFGDWPGQSKSNVIDGLDETLMIAESKYAVAWTRPDEIRFHLDGPLPELGNHYGKGFLGLYASGKVDWFPAQTPQARLRGLINISDRSQ